MNNKIRKPGKSYISEKVYLKYHSSLTNGEAENLIGKQIAKIESDEFHLIFIFTDGSKLIVRGFTIDENKSFSSLDTQLIEKTIDL